VFARGESGRVGEAGNPIVGGQSECVGVVPSRGEEHMSQASTQDLPFARGRMLVIGFLGWNDAGDAASSAVRFLSEAASIDRLIEKVDDEDFFDYSIHRPAVRTTDEGERKIEWPGVLLLGPREESDEADDEDLDDEDGLPGDDGRLPAAGGEAGVAADDVRDLPGDGFDDVPLAFLDVDGVAEVEVEDELDEDDADDAEEPDDADRGLASDAELDITGSNSSNVYLLIGPEPTLRWRSFADRIIDLCERNDVQRIVFVGALLADAPHTRPINVFVSSDDAAVRRELEIGRSDYQGPTGVFSPLQQRARQAGIRCVSLWASVPHYAQQAPSPKATLALLDKLEEIIDVSIPRGSLVDDAEAWEREVTEAMAQEEEVTNYVRFLERSYDMTAAPEASGEAIAKEFERFLRQSQSPATGAIPSVGLPGPGKGQQPPVAGTASLPFPGDAPTSGDADAVPQDAGSAAERAEPAESPGDRMPPAEPPGVVDDEATPGDGDPVPPTEQTPVDEPSPSSTAADEVDALEHLLFGDLDGDADDGDADGDGDGPSGRDTSDAHDDPLDGFDPDEDGDRLF